MSYGGRGRGISPLGGNLTGARAGPILPTPVGGLLGGITINIKIDTLRIFTVSGKEPRDKEKIRPGIKGGKASHKNGKGSQEIPG